MAIRENHENQEAEVQSHDERLAALCGSIRRSFPAEPYTGKVTLNDAHLVPVAGSVLTRSRRCQVRPSSAPV